MSIVAVFALLLLVSSVNSYEQAVLEPLGSDWTEPPHVDETAHLIFSSVSSLLQHWPNTLYRNGHAIVPGSITPGTLLYHGTSQASPPPPGPEWLSFDPEHSAMFGNKLITYVVGSKALRIIYFDGSSAAKMPTGPMDTQEILMHGELREGEYRNEWGRIAELCSGEWVKDFGIQGFVRMEFDFEVMICDFNDGISVVEEVNQLPYLHRVRKRPRPEESLDAPPPGTPPPRHFPGNPPEGWKGSLRPFEAIDFDGIQAGNWHNPAPGLPGVKLNYSSLLTFFDPRYSSLVEARHAAQGNRNRMRVGNITKEDAEIFWDDLRTVLRRSASIGSTTDWASLFRTIQDRTFPRLDFFSALLQKREQKWAGGSLNSTEAIYAVRQAAFAMLWPFMSNTTVPTSQADPTWMDATFKRCAALWTKGINDIDLTTQERLLKRSLDVVSAEICRTMSLLWIDVFDAEHSKVTIQESLLQKWALDIGRLKDWLNWANFIHCDPPCGALEMCSLPQWPFNVRGEINPEMVPRCLSKITFDWGKQPW